MRVARGRVAWLFALVGVLAVAAHGEAGARQARTGGYLYIAFGSACCPGSQIWRYALRDGYPHARPDMKITGYSWPLATDASGNLYAAGGQSVYEFPRGSATPVRHVY